MKNILIDKKSVHFIGVGGVSMSGLAEILLSQGYKVSGSDINYSDSIRHLETLGLTFYKGHNAQNINSADAIVYTSAVKADNPEMSEAKRSGKEVINRAELLGYIMNGYKKSIAVAGTHGKTTVTSMISYIFEKLSCDPTILVGAHLDIIGGNMKQGHSEYIIAEACEYCRSFLSFYPFAVTILNVEPDHLDYYKDADDYHSAYSEFLENVSRDGFVIACNEDKDLINIVKNVPQKLYTYGLTEGDFTVKNVCTSKAGTTFLLLYKEETICEVKLSLHGNHNILNAVAALANAFVFGLDMQKSADALTDFSGASRRFEYRGTLNDAEVYDDYAHHPTEIKATIDTAKGKTSGRIICVFQPHTYSRTKAFLDDFANSFSGVDMLILADIYAAREKDDGSISSKMLADKIQMSIPECYYFDSFDKIADKVKSIVHKNDTVIIMGAGDIVKLTDILLQ